MAYMRTPGLIAAALVFTAGTAVAGNFGETMVASGIGATFGSMLGNAISRPSSVTVVKERRSHPVVVEYTEEPDVVYVTETSKRLSRLNRQARDLERKLLELRRNRNNLYAQKEALERRVAQVNREIAHVEATITQTVDALEDVHARQDARACQAEPAVVSTAVVSTEAAPAVVVTKGKHIGSVVA